MHHFSPALEPDEENKIINLNIEVQENGQFFVNRIEFTGNNYTRDKVIRREMLMQEGELLRVNVFAKVWIEFIVSDFSMTLSQISCLLKVLENKADVSIDVKENKRNEIRSGRRLQRI